MTSLDPLVAYLYEDGLVKFCTRRYTSDHGGCSDPYIHLTDEPIQLSDAIGNNVGPSQLHVAEADTGGPPRSEAKLSEELSDGGPPKPEAKLSD